MKKELNNTHIPFVRLLNLAALECPSGIATVRQADEDYHPAHIICELWQKEGAEEMTVCEA
jgi:hypothetical protein